MKPAVPKTPEQQEAEQKADGTANWAMAEVQCEDHVREFLKSPSTATFSGLGDTEVRGADHKYAIIGWVDSQNSFGATLRTNYICKVTDEGGGNWTFEPLITNDGN